MANKNKHVIIGYFPSKEAATEAADQLKQWDKANDDVKLGGMGILTWENGKIKSRKVGNRAGGTGAKWGLILGAATGILSGGVTLIGGAAVGVVGGAVAGSLFHKHLGLTDADKDRLQQYLQNGGAAVVVMADEDEVEPAKAELASLGGQVENYEVPEETVAQVEEAVEVEEVAGEAADHVDERTEVLEADIPPSAVLKGKVRDIQGVGPERSAALAAAGIVTRRELLERGATPEGRAEIAEQSKIGEKLIANWVSAVDLLRVHGRRPAERRAARGRRRSHGGRPGPAGRSRPARETGCRQRESQAGARSSGRGPGREGDRSGEGTSAGSDRLAAAPRWHGSDVWCAQGVPADAGGSDQSVPAYVI